MLAPGVHRTQDNPPRTTTVDVPVGANGGEIEYMVRMKQGEVLVYSCASRRDLAPGWHTVDPFLHILAIRSLTTRPAPGSTVPVVPPGLGRA